MDEITESLYFAEIKLLTTYCSNCLDSKMKDKLMLFLLKKTLYDNAVELGFSADAENYYKEMLNLLDLRTCGCDITKGSTCKTCANGTCELCK
jgi:hypothetical protein